MKNKNELLENKYLSLDEAAKLLRMHVVTLRMYIKKGTIPAYRIGRQYRIERDELIEWVRQNKMPAAK